jgi:hypothetical protein
MESSAPAADAGQQPQAEPVRLDNNDDIAVALGSMDDGADQGEDSAPVETADEPATPETGEEAGDAADDEPQVDDTDTDDIGDVAAPEGWSDAAKGEWANLPDTLRAEITQREAAYGEALAREAQNTAAALQRGDKYIQDGSRVLQEAMTAAKLAIEADFAGIDWNKLQMTDPATYLQLDAQLKQRRSDVSRLVEAHNAFQQQQMANFQQHVAAQINSETANVLPKIKAIVGAAYEPKAFVKDVTAYLQGIGAPDDHINNISHGYMLEMATKAMLYDKQASAREAALKKVAAAPKVQTARGRPVTGKQGPDVAGALKIIETGGSSNDNVALALSKL